MHGPSLLPTALAALAAGALALPAAAPAAPIASGQLEWSQANVYEASPSPVKTFMGYITGTGFLANGTVAPIAPATGPVVGASSVRGAAEWYTHVLPISSGDWDPDTGRAWIELDGGVAFNGTAHGFTNTVERPLLTLDGNAGTLAASGARNVDNVQTTYDRGRPVFSLNLADAVVVHRADGTREIADIVPTIATAQNPFPANYPVGAGPDRTPNTFGRLTLKLKLQPSAAAGPVGPAGPAGRPGPAGPAGATTTVTNTVRRYVVHLRRAPFKGRASRNVRLTTSGKHRRTVATGTLRGRVLRVTLRAGTTSLKGSYRVKARGIKRTKQVTVGA